MSSIYIYWDESHFWGLLIHRALTAWNIPHRLVRGTEIAQGVLAGKPDGQIPRALIVPGGRARGKADRLGKAGLAAVLDYVASGGVYIGFCGGTGLGLTGSGGLDLCPWQRMGFTDRLQHFLSGHIRVSLAEDEWIPEDLQGEALLPVWWPAQFAPEGGRVKPLARYDKPGPDFWVADLKLASLPEDTLSDWQAMYGIELVPSFLRDRPCVAMGRHGQGRYILSYLHLETPASPQANRWLSHILDRILSEQTDRPALPAWDVSATVSVRSDTVLLEARRILEDIISTGQEHFLLFWRTPWLLGWRRGIPGSLLNSLYCMTCEALATEDTESAAEYWRQERNEMARLLELFHEGVTGYLLAERLAMTVQHTNNSAISTQALKEQRAALFGHPARPGGIFVELSTRLEELLWRQKAT